MKDNDEKLQYRIHVTGYVQGVGFRWRTVREAASRRIKGFVKNMPDGSVYIEAEGTRKQLRDFAEWCRKGPGHVESITVDVYPPANYSDFSVKY
jgi:acylphosphatase